MRLFAGAIGFGLALMIPCVGSATLFIPSAAFRQIYFSNSETVAFRPTIADGGTVTFGTSSPSRRLWRANPGGFAEVAVQTGQSTPSVGGGTLTIGTYGEMSRDGRLLFSSFIDNGTPITQAIFRAGLGTALAPQVTAPTALEGAVDHTFVSFNGAAVRFGANGSTAFPATIRQGTSGPTRDALVRSAANVNRLVVAAGDPAPGMPAGTVFHPQLRNSILHSVNGSGEVFFSALVVKPGNVISGGIWRSNDSGLSPVILWGEPIPGSTGGVFKGMDELRVNDRGDVVFRGGEEYPGGVSRQGAWLRRADGFITRAIDPAAATPIPGTTPQPGQTAVVNGRGVVVGPVENRDAGGAFVGHSYALRREDGTFVRLIQHRDVLPGVPPQHYVNNIFPPVLNVLGTTAFAYSEADHMGGTDALAVYGIDGSLQFHVRPGDQVQTAVGQIRTVDRVGFAAINQQLPSTVFSGVGGEDGWRTPLNAQNQLVMTISFTDNSQGVYVVTIPEPFAGGAAAVLTCFGLLRRVPGLSGRRERAE